MTNYEKIIKDMDIKKFALMMQRNGTCLFDVRCADCFYHTEPTGEDYPLCNIMQIMLSKNEEMIKWLESEVEE